MLEIEALGATIVFANSNKLILATGRSSQSDGEHYCEFVVKSIRASPSFTYLQLDPTRYWRVLLFKDSYNFGGVAISDPALNTKILSNWHVLELLPEEIIKYGLALLAQTIHECFNTINITLPSTDFYQSTNQRFQWHRQVKCC